MACEPWAPLPACPPACLTGAGQRDAVAAGGALLGAVSVDACRGGGATGAAGARQRTAAACRVNACMHGHTLCCVPDLISPHLHICLPACPAGRGGGPRFLPGPGPRAPDPRQLQGPAAHPPPARRWGCCWGRRLLTSSSDRSAGAGALGMPAGCVALQTRLLAGCRMSRH